MTFEQRQFIGQLLVDLLGMTQRFLALPECLPLLLDLRHQRRRQVAELIGRELRQVGRRVHSASMPACRGQWD